MKKLLSILLVLGLLLTLAPLALADAEPVVEEDGPVIEEPAAGDEPAAVGDEPVIEEPAADGVDVGSGTHYISQFANDSSLKLKADATIIVDRDQTIRGISGSKALTITVQSGKTLTLYNPDGHAVDIYSLTINGSGKVNVIASKNGLYTNKNIQITGVDLTVNTGSECIYSRYGTVTVTCNATLRSTHGIPIYARMNKLTLGGNITAVTTDDDSPCIRSGGSDGESIYAGQILFTGGSYSMTAKGDAIYGHFGDIELTGDIHATSSEGRAVVSDRIKVFGTPITGTITLNGANIEAKGGSAGIYCGGDIVIIDSEITASGSEYGIYGGEGITMGARLSVLTPATGWIGKDAVYYAGSTVATTVRIGLPRVPGTAKLSYPDDVPYVGDTVGLSLSSDVPRPYSVQWEISENGWDFKDIPGAVGNTYTIRPEQKGLKIQARITATGYGEPLRTPGAFIYERPAISGGVKINGSVVHYGDTLSCSLQGDAVNIPASKLHYQWQMSEDKGEHWTNIPGATGTSWKSPSDGDKVVSVRVLVTADGYTGQLFSDRRALNVNSSTVNEIAGTVKIVQGSIYETVFMPGSTIKATWYNTAGKEVLADVVYYQWQRSADNMNWEDIPGATSRTYSPTRDDELWWLRVEVTAKYTVGELHSESKQVTYVFAQYNVTYDMQGHGEQVPQKRNIRRGAKLMPPAPEPKEDGYDFGGWYTDAACTKPYDFDAPVLGHMTLYAKWTVSAKPSVTLSSDAKSAQASNFSGLYARVALVLDNNGVSGLYVTQTTINPDGSIVMPSFMVPGLKVKAVNIALVPSLADIQSATPTVKASDFKML